MLSIVIYKSHFVGEMMHSKHWLGMPDIAIKFNFLINIGGQR